MKKWFKALRELIRDVVVFLQIRNEHLKVYSPIIEDLEAINVLANALNDQIREFSHKWDLFPETEGLMKSYRKYYFESQNIYKVTRKDILNKLLAERNKKGIDDNVELLQVRRHQDNQEPDEPDWGILVELVSIRNPLLGKILNVCDKSKIGNVVYIQVGRKNKTFLDILLKYKRDIETYCSDFFHENIAVEITEIE